MTHKASRTSRALAAVLAAAAAWCAAPAAKAEAEQSIQPALKEQLATDAAAAASQERINGFSDETREMLLRSSLRWASARLWRRAAISASISFKPRAVT